MSPLINLFKKNYLVAVLLFIFIGIFFLYKSNDYKLVCQTIRIVENNKIKDQIIYKTEPKKILLQLVGTIFINFAITIFIALFFVRYIERQDRELFEHKLQQFQKDTAEDAILSVFKRIMEEEFFEIIKEELLNAKLVRKNANWQYDIKKSENNKMILKRTISYELHNMSLEDADEPMSPIFSDNIHSKAIIKVCKIRKHDGTEEDVFPLEQIETKPFSKSKKNIKVSPLSYVEVVFVVEEEFKREYIFETHFTNYPIINLEIVVNFPEDYIFDLNDSFSTKCRLKINELGKKIYTVRGGIYKGQGVDFICFPQDYNNQQELTDT